MKRTRASSKATKGQKGETSLGDTCKNDSAENVGFGDEKDQHGGLRAKWNGNITDHLPIDANEVCVPINKPSPVVNPASGIALCLDHRGCTPYLLTFVECDSCHANDQIFYLGEDGHIFRVGCPGLILVLEATGNVGIWLKLFVAQNEDQKWKFNNDESSEKNGFRGMVSWHGNGIL